MRIKEYKKGDEIEILNLFNMVFKKKMSLEYWKWRFANNPVGKIMIKLMWDKEKLVGHYALSPVKIDFSGKEIITGLSMTTMTHPAYLGLGIFTELAEKLYQDYFKENKLTAIWGFPNNNSHYGFIKNLHWKDIEQIPCFSLQIENLKSTSIEGIKVSDIFRNAHEIAYKKANESFNVKIVKDINYLEWRYLKNPENSYSIFELEREGFQFFSVTKIYKNSTSNLSEVDIVELNFPAERATLLQLLNAIKNHYSDHSIVKFNTWIPIKDPKHILLESIGFINNTPITYAGVRVMDNNYNDLYFADNWSYCMGDSDVY